MVTSTVTFLLTAVKISKQVERNFKFDGFGALSDGNGEPLCLFKVALTFFQ